MKLHQRATVLVLALPVSQTAAQPTASNSHLPDSMAWVVLERDGALSRVVGLHIEPGVVVAPWSEIATAQSAVLEFACCDAVPVLGVIGHDAEYRLVLLRCEPPARAKVTQLDRLQPLAMTDWPGRDALFVTTLIPIGFEDVYGTISNPSEVYSARAWHALGDVARCDASTTINAPGALVVANRSSQTHDPQTPIYDAIGMTLGWAGGRQMFAAPLSIVQHIERHEPVSLADYSHTMWPTAQQARVLAEQAGQLRTEGELVRAAATAQRALALDDNQWMAWYQLGVARDMLGDDGADALRRAVSIEDEFCEPWFSLGILHLKAGQPQRALEPLRNAQRRGPHHADACAMEGVAFMHMGRLEEAIAPMRRSIEIDPRKEHFYINLASALARVRPDEVEPLWKQAVEKMPDSALAHTRLGTLLFEKDPSGAIDHLEAAVGLAPRDNDARLQLAMLLIQTGQEQRGRALLDAIVRDDPDSPIAQMVIKATSGGGG